MSERRELTQQEQQAVEAYLGLTCFAQLYVEGERIMQKIEDDAIDTTVVCTLLWLARMDFKRNNILQSSEEDVRLPEQVHVLEHALARDHLMHLRNKETKLQKFRHHSDQLCHHLFRAAIADLATEDVFIKTPLAEVKQPKLKERVVVAPVFRAGLAMMTPAMQLLPKSTFGFAGIRRDEENDAQAEEYYWNMPKINGDSVVVITDPMLATGGTVLHMLRRMKKENIQPKAIRVVCVVAAPEGMEAILHEFPDVEIHTAAVDSHLNDIKYIVPGLGDYGDRYFGTDGHDSF